MHICARSKTAIEPRAGGLTNPGSGHHDLLLAALHLVGEADDHPELHWLLVARHGQQGPASKLLLVNLNQNKLS